MKIDMNAKLKASGMRSEHLLDQFLKAGYNPSRMADSEDIHGSEYPCIERSLLFPPEFIYGLTTRDGSDVIPFTSDIAVASTTLYNGRLIREAMKKAALKEYKQSCSFQVAAVGLTLMGRYPKPAATCYVNEPCMSSLETFRTIAREQGTPFHELDVPRIYNKEAAIYVEKRLAEIAREIERETSGNIKMDFDKLDQAIEHSNQARENFIGAFEQMKGPGRLMKGFENASYALFCSQGFGSPEFVEIARTMKEELTERRTYLDQHPQEDEKPRIMLVHFPPYSNHKIMKEIDDRGDVVNAEVNVIWWDPIEYPGLRGLAYKMGALKKEGWSIENRSKNLHLPTIIDYDIDGVILFQHMFGGICPMATEPYNLELQHCLEEAGKKRGREVKYLRLPLDVIQGSNTPANTETLIDTFFEKINLEKTGLPL